MFKKHQLVTVRDSERGLYAHWKSLKQNYNDIFEKNHLPVDESYHEFHRHAVYKETLHWKPAKRNTPDIEEHRPHYGLYTVLSYTNYLNSTVIADVSQCTIFDSEKPWHREWEKAIVKYTVEKKNMNIWLIIVAVLGVIETTLDVVEYLWHSWTITKCMFSRRKYTRVASMIFVFLENTSMALITINVLLIYDQTNIVLYYVDNPYSKSSLTLT